MSASYASDLARHVNAQLLSRIEKVPAPRILENLFETLYFASLKREEAQSISCRIAFIDRSNPDPKPPRRIVADRWKYFPLSSDLPFNVPNLVKLSKAVDPWGSTLAVDTDADGKLRIWGLIDQSVHYSTYVAKEASSAPEMPGMFQAVIHGVGEIAAYKSYVLLGSLNQDVLVTKQQRVFQSGPIHSKLMAPIRRYRDRAIERVGEDVYKARDHWDASLEALWISALCRILIGIQRYGHGGAVLISNNPAGLSPKYSLLYPRLADSLARVAIHQIQNTHQSDQIYENYLDLHEDDIPTDLYLTETASNAELRDTNDEVTGCVRFLASLSRIDGLIWLDLDLRMRAFGVEITLKADPKRVRLAQNSRGTQTRKLNLNHYGMRHRSMLRYCAANPKSVGFVVSQDGDVRAITRLRDRVLLWDNVRIQSILNPKTASLE
jgi:sensor domain DACNV-containing protein